MGNSAHAAIVPLLAPDADTTHPGRAPPAHAEMP
jgi:hypothetical protein